MKFVPQVFALFVFMSGTLNAQVQVAFKHAYLKVEPPFQVSDVLQVSGESDHLIQLKWPEYLLKNVSRQQVSDWLASQSKPNTSFKWHGRQGTYIEPCYKPDATVLARQLDDVISQELKLLGIETTKVVYKGQHVPCASHAVNAWEWDIQTPISQPQANVKLTITNIQGVHVSALVPVSITASVKGLTLLTSIDKNNVLAVSMMKARTRPWTGKEMSFKQFSDIERQWVALKSLSKGTILRNDSVRLSNDIELGQSVQIYLINGAVRLETTGRSLSAGNVGDVIQVKVEDAYRVAKGTVMSKGVVNVSV